MLSFGNRSSLLACNTLIKRVGVYRFSRGGDAGHHQTSSLILSNGSCISFSRHYSIPTSSTSTELNSFLDTLFKKKKTNTSFFSDLLAVEDDSGHSSNWTLTQNGSLAYKSSGSALVDFFYKSVEGISQRGIHQLLSQSWQEDPTRTLKVIFFILDIRQGKGEKKIFYECQRWLALHHPKTFLANLKFISKFGYWKDLLNLLSYIRYGGYEMDERPRWFQRQQNHLSRLPSVFGLKQFLRYLKRCSYNKTEDKDHISEELTEMDILRHMKNISESRELMEFSAQEKIILRQSYLQAREIIVDLYVDQLRKDKEYMIKKSQAQPSQPVGIHSLCAKWAPSIGRSADKLLDGIGLDIAKKLFPLGEEGGIQLTKRQQGLGDANFTDEQVYEYLAKIKYQKEYLAPLRAATPVIETFMAAKRWSEIPYQRVPSVCMHRNKKLFMRRDLERFSEFLGKVVKGEQKISGKVLFPHQIVENLMVEKDKNAILTLELQWKTLVENTRTQGNFELANCLPICDVSGSMNGQPMNVAMALSILMSELNDNPFKGLICTFSEKPEFVSLNPKAPLRERLFTLSAANWSMNTNYQKVFDLILEKAVSNNLAKDQMIRKMVVFSDMQFDESCGRTKTDHQLIREKFERHGYTVPEIVYWNLNGTYNTIPVTKNEQGVALLSGFSASLLRLLTQTSSFSVEALIDASIQKPRYECLVLED